MKNPTHKLQKKLINLMLRHSEVVSELVEHNINPDYFDEKFQPLVQAIFYVHGISDGKRLLTEDHYRKLLIEQGGKGDITIAMQVQYECLYGVHHSNSKNDLDMLVQQVTELYVHREGIEALDALNKSVGKLGYVEATRRYIDRLHQTIAVTEATAPTIPLNSIEPETVTYLWANRIPAGKLSIVQGPPGEGKSMITLDLAARVSSGTNMPNTSIPTVQGDVLLVSCEDGVKDTIVPRLRSFDHANLSRIHVLDQSKGLLDLSRNLSQLRQAAKGLEDLKLIVLDPLSAYLGEGNSHEDAQVRRVLGPLCEFAENLNVAVLGIMHLNKDKNKDLLQRALGSVAFGATARSVFMVAKDREGRRVFSHIKSNLCRLSGTIEFTIEDNHGQPRLQWDSKIIYDDPKVLFAPHQPIQDAQEWLAGELQDGPEDSKLIFKKAESRGFSARTLNRAKKRMGIEPQKKGLNDGWEWKL